MKTIPIYTLLLLCLTLHAGFAQFQQHTIQDFDNGFEKRRPVVADFDGNGAPDIIADFAIYNDGLALLTNDGAGRFSAPNFLSIPTNWGQAVRAGDIDGDQDIDLVLVLTSDSIVWLPNNGTGAFGMPNTVVSNIPISESTLEVGDIDGDGDQDVLAYNTNANRDIAILNDGNGNFAAPVSANPKVLSFDNGFQFRDLDQDGDQDAIYFSAFSIRWSANDGTASMVAPENLITTNPYYIKSFDIGDIDGDGHLDLAVSFLPGGALVWYKNDGNQHFSIEAEINLVSGGPVEVIMEDFDKDGDQDILTTGALGFNPMNGPTVALYLNNGTGQFDGPYWIDGENDHWYILSADINQDGFSDILFQNVNTLGWYENRYSKIRITGLVYHDKNEDGLLVGGEVVLQNIPVHLTPPGITTYTNENGLYAFFMPPGNYEVSTTLPDCWELIAATDTFQVQTVPNQISEQSFAVRSLSDEVELESDIQSAPTICDKVVPVWVTVANNSCTEATGSYELTLSDLVTFAGADPAPDINAGNVLSWSLGVLQPTESRPIQLHLQMPDEGFADSTIVLNGRTFYEDSGNLVEVDTNSYQSTLDCSFDPNDKLVDRTELFPNYTSKEAELLYTVRFQNTGTATAATVLILDTLDQQLDWNSFQPVAASHDYIASIDQNEGIVQFLFEDIMLPDSAGNEPESHGFISFNINIKPGLGAGTMAKNRAAIFFDQNEPVVTNTAITSVAALTPTTIYETDLTFNLFPNPAVQRLSVLFSEPVRKQLIISLYDIQGKRLQSGVVPPAGRLMHFDVSGLIGGAYLVVLENEHGRRYGKKIIIK